MNVKHEGIIIFAVSFSLLCCVFKITSFYHYHGCSKGILPLLWAFGFDITSQVMRVLGVHIEGGCGGYLAGHLGNFLFRIWKLQ